MSASPRLTTSISSTLRQAPPSASPTARLDRKQSWKKGTTHWDDGRVEGSEEHSADELLIDSIRHDEVPGIHTINYDSPADAITITHNAHSREGFALGAVLAAEYTLNHSGLLTTDDLFKF